MLVIRTVDGEIRWMDVSAYLKRESAGGKTVRQIIFAGERFDAVSVQNWRKKLLGQGPAWPPQVAASPSDAWQPR
jgi:hypothetical protein